MDADFCGPNIKCVGTHQILLHVLKPNMSERDAAVDDFNCKFNQIFLYASMIYGMDTLENN